VRIRSSPPIDSPSSCTGRSPDEDNDDFFNLRTYVTAVQSLKHLALLNDAAAMVMKYPVGSGTCLYKMLMQHLRSNVECFRQVIDDFCCVRYCTCRTSMLRRRPNVRENLDVKNSINYW